MNFLSHDFILPAHSPSITRVGAFLPDLWALLPRRPLPLAVVRSLRASEEPQAQHLADGIESHLRADAVFHGHPEFGRRTSEAARDLSEAFAGVRHAHLAAHVAVEMLLDRWLIERDPGILDSYYGALDEGSLHESCRLAFAQVEQRMAARRLLDRFVASAFLREYRSDRGMVGRWLRSLQRTAFADNGELDEDCLTGWMGAWRDRFDEGSSELLGQVRRSVDNWVVDHPPA